MRYMLAFSDLQLSNNLPYGVHRQGYNSRLIEQFAAVKEIAEAALELEAPVVFAGDWFDERRVDAQTLEISARIVALFRKNRIPLVIVAGNHDFADREVLVTPLSQYRRLLEGRDDFVFKIVDFATIVDFGDVALAAYAAGHFTPEAALEASAKMGAGKKQILVLHEMIKGGKFPNRTVIQEGVERTDLERLLKVYDFVVAGDVHKPQFLSGDRAFYCGSPLQYDFGDAGQKKGYFVVDLEERKAEFRPTKCKQTTFHEFKAKDEADLEAALRGLDAVMPVVRVRLAADFAFSREEWRRKFEAKGTVKVLFEDETVSPVAPGEVLSKQGSGDFSLGSYFSRYLDATVPEKMKDRKGKMKELEAEGRKLLEEAGIRL